MELGHDPAAMGRWPCTLMWAGFHFTLRPLQDSPPGPPGSDWAIWRGREFVGVVPGVPGETANALRARACDWLAALYEA